MPTPSSLATILQRMGVDALDYDTELTPDEAAELLQVSRLHLVSFMDNGTLPFHRVGTQRHITMSDLTVFVQHKRRGKEVLANALRSSSQPRSTVELTEDEVAELDDL